MNLSGLHLFLLFHSADHVSIYSWVPTKGVLIRRRKMVNSSITSVPLSCIAMIQDELPFL